MSQEKPSLNAAIRHLAERERRSDHPTPRELTAYHEGSLPPEAEARVREHLALCRHCSDLLLDLAGFATLTPPAGVPELTDAEVEEDWQALKAKLGAEMVGGREEEARGKAGVVVPMRPPSMAPPPAVPSRRKTRFWAQAAAVVLAAGIGLMAGLSLAPKPKPYEEGVAGTLDINPTRGGGVEEELPSYPRAQPLLLAYSPSKKDTRFEVQVYKDEHEVWRRSYDVEELFQSGRQPLVPGEALGDKGRYSAKLYVWSESNVKRQFLNEKQFEIDAP